MDAAKILLHLRRVEVHRRRDDMARHLVAELDDVFAEIGLHRRDAVLFEMLVDPDFLGDHRFALGDGPGARVLADRQDDAARLLRVAGEMHVPARCRHLLLISLEIEVEMLQGVVFDVARRVPQGLEFRQPFGRLLPLVDEALLDVPQRLLELRVAERARGILLEIRRGAVNAHRTWSFRHSDRRFVRHSGENFRDVAHVDRTAVAGEFARHVEKASEIARKQRRAPVSTTLRAFASTIAPEMSLYFTAKVPPKPQHTSLSSSSTSVRPSTLARSLRGWLRTPSSRNPEQES